MKTTEQEAKEYAEKFGDLIDVRTLAFVAGAFCERNKLKNTEPFRSIVAANERYKNAEKVNETLKAEIKRLEMELGQKIYK
jgi:hypothetical protein